MARLKALFFKIVGKETWAGQLALLLLASSGFWAFIEIAEEVGEGESKSVDTALILLFREKGDLSDPIGPVWFEEMARDITALGSHSIIILMALVILGLLFFLGKKKEALFSLGALTTGAILTHFLKLGFERPRPEIVAHHTEVITKSFPSGHSMLATLTFLSLSVLASSALTSKKAKVYLIGMAILISIAVGISRVYLGVHWPSDVLAGIVLGASWAILWRSLEIRFGESLS